MIKEDGSTPVSFPLVTFLGGGEGGVDSCHTMNFVLLMLLGVNRVNAAAYPELQISRGGGGGDGGGGTGEGLGRGGGGGAGEGGRSLTLDPPLECVCHLMHGSVRCIVVVCLSFFVVVVFFPNLKQKVNHSFCIFG